jgi:hypothetical protein
MVAHSKTPRRLNSAQMAWEVHVLDDGGTADFSERGSTRVTLPPVKRYRRPYEGTDNLREAMQGYLDWEFGLVAQLARDGTHHFRVN